MEPATSPAITVSHLRKSYGDVDVLDDVSFTVGEGEIFGLLGANGAGKTTAVEIIQGLRSRGDGAIDVVGCDPVADRHRLRDVVGSQLQSSALPDRLRVGEALRLFADLAGDLVDWRQLAGRWSLTGLLSRPFGALSGGQRQRLFVALALVNRPRVVFLDELTQGLDAGARRQAWDLIEEVRATGTTVVLVTHFMDEAERLGDRIAVLHRGRIAFEGRSADLVTAVGGPVRIRFSAPAAVTTDLVRLPGVTDVAADGATVDVGCHAGAVVPVVARLDELGMAPTDLTVLRPTLEDAFIALTDPTATPVATDSIEVHE